MKNLKFLFLFSAFVFAGINVNAQAIGVKVGGTFSKINYESDIIANDKIFLPGIQAGVIFSMAIFPFMDIQPEVLLYQKGVKYKGEVLGVEYESFNSIYYVDVPINIRIKPPVIPIYVIAGPYFGYALQGTSYYELGSVILTDNVPIEFSSDGTRQFDFGVDAGLGFIKDFGPIHFFLEARYNYGLADLSGSDNQTAKNANIGVATGILLGFK
jgi:hypothetical protein